MKYINLFEDFVKGDNHCYLNPKEWVDWDSNSFDDVKDFFKNCKVDDEIVLVDIRVKGWEGRSLYLLDKLIRIWKANSVAKPIRMKNMWITKPFPLYHMSKVFSDEFGMFFLPRKEADKLEHEGRGGINLDKYHI